MSAPTQNLGFKFVGYSNTINSITYKLRMSVLILNVIVLFLQTEMFESMIFYVPAKND